MEKEVTLTPVMQQYVRIKSEYKNEVVFFRLGDFYEMFMEDAVEVSRLLNLTLTHKGDQYMCGIPYHASKVYIARLLRLGKKIVMCEQVGDPKAKGLTERKVVEIITPGTATEEEYLEGNANNYLASLCIHHGTCGFAFIDVSTSSFKVTSWKASVMEENFGKELGRAMPRELLLPNSLKNNSIIQDAISLLPSISVSYYPDWDFNPDQGYKKLCRQFKTQNLKAFSIEEDSAEASASGFLLDYLEKTTNSSLMHISSISLYHDKEYLIIDESSRRNLEIVYNLRDGSTNYTLLECVNHGLTAMGSRLIRSWLLYPLTNKASIISRQSHVSLFVDNSSLLNKVRSHLSGILDIERLAGRIAMDRAHAKDLKALESSLTGYLKVRSVLNDYDFVRLDEEACVNIIDLISSSIMEDPSTSLTEGRIIKEGWSEELDHLRNVRDNFDSLLRQYEEEERESTGIPNLKIKYNNAQGYFIEISKGKLGQVPSHFIMRRTLVNGDRYTTERLQELERELTEAGSRILCLERDLFLEIRNKLHEFIPYLLSLSEVLAYTDACQSFAYASSLYSWSKPLISDSKIFNIKGGRHPVVEAHLPSGEFVPNDLELCTDNKAFALITGPNMAGKSTFLRQNALIALLAQVGSYVPCSYCEIGIVDRIFCRVGASDNLAKGESTFLVEMTETANILRSATESSFVIMDEVGRGTSTEDGLSIAWAISEYLLSEIKCRTLFATHYHELTRLEDPNLKLLCMDVSECNGTVTFLRKVKDGASENSYGIHVARLAGVPERVINRANVILSHIQELSDKKGIISYDTPCEEPSVQAFQTPGLFSDEEIILDEILSSDTDNMTPIQALQLVARWKKALSGV